MELNGINSDDYIYLKFHQNFDDFKKGDIIRFNINDLRKTTFQDKISLYSHIEGNSYFEFVSKENITKQDIFPHQLYKYAIVKERTPIIKIRINRNDIVLINDMTNKLLFSEVSNGSIFFPKTIKQANEEVLENHINLINESDILPYDNSLQNNNLGILSTMFNSSFNKIIKKYGVKKIFYTNRDLYLDININIGDILDFNNPAIVLLFTNQYYLHLATHVDILDENEKLKEFIKDFDSFCYTEKQHFRYYKLNYNIKITKISDFKHCPILCSILDRTYEEKRQGWNYLRWYQDTLEDLEETGITNKLDYDSSGYLRYLCIEESKPLEEELLKIASKLPMEETIYHYEHINDLKKLKKEVILYYWKHKAEYKKFVKNTGNTSYLQFMKENEKKLNQIKFFINKRLINILKSRIIDLENRQESQKVKKLNINQK